MAEFVKVAKLSELPEGKGTCVEAGGERIALFNLGNNKVYAIEDTCTHMGGPLSEGYVEEGEVECPWHGAYFDVETGEVQSAPAEEDVLTFNVRVSGDDVEVEI